MASASTAASASAPAQQNQLVHHLLLPEILGFSPQLLLDDIINIANNAVQDGVNGMEEFLKKWVDERAGRKSDAHWDSTQEVEQGLVAFQTLLEHHTDIAFDFFEAWSLRNIFAIPPDLPIVLPHQQGLDLTQVPQREMELMEEIDELRKQVHTQRQLRRMLQQGIRASKQDLRRSEKRLAELSLLESPTLDTLSGLPAKLTAMYNTVSALPPPDPSIITSLARVDPAKRLWETSTVGYKKWAVERLLERDRPEGSRGRSAVDLLVENADLVGDPAQLRMAIEAVGGVKDDFDAVGNFRAEGMEE